MFEFFRSLYKEWKIDQLKSILFSSARKISSLTEKGVELDIKKVRLEAKLSRVPSFDAEIQVMTFRNYDRSLIEHYVKKWQQEYIAKINVELNFVESQIYLTETSLNEFVGEYQKAFKRLLFLSSSGLASATCC